MIRHDMPVALRRPRDEDVSRRDFPTARYLASDGEHRSGVRERNRDAYNIRGGPRDNDIDASSETRIAVPTDGGEQVPVVAGKRVGSACIVMGLV